jgi:hypothetical protein
MASPPSQELLDSALRVAQDAAREAGKVIVAAWDHPKNIQTKSKSTFNNSTNTTIALIPPSSHFLFF